MHNDGKSENYETKNFKGNINNHSCIEIKSNLTIYKYKNEDEGVYKLVNTYIRGNDENPEKNEFGRIYILKGDAKDANAKVYQLVPFDEGEIQNFLYTDKKLILLNSKFELPANKED